jgi:Sporulation protein Cse60
MIMVKIKVFDSDSSGDVERLFNDFMEKNPNINIMEIMQSESQCDSVDYGHTRYFSITILYKVN